MNGWIKAITLLVIVALLVGVVMGGLAILIGKWASLLGIVVVGPIAGIAAAQYGYDRWVA